MGLISWTNFPCPSLIWQYSLYIWSLTLLSDGLNISAYKEKGVGS